MMKKPFFESTLRKIDDELAEINPSDHTIYFGPILPGEEVVGEMNDFEKKAFIWNELMMDKLREVSNTTNSDVFYADSGAVDQFTKELELIVAKIKFLELRLFGSLIERFGIGKTLAFREKFQIVISKESIEDIEADIEKHKEAVLIEFSNVGNKSNLKPN